VRKVIAVTRIDGEHIGSVVEDTDARSLALAPLEGYVFTSFKFTSLAANSHCNFVLFSV